MNTFAIKRGCLLWCLTPCDKKTGMTRRCFFVDLKPQSPLKRKSEYISEVTHWSGVKKHSTTYSLRKGALLTQAAQTYVAQMEEQLSSDGKLNGLICTFFFTSGTRLKLASFVWMKQTITCAIKDVIIIKKYFFRIMIIALFKFNQVCNQFKWRKYKEVVFKFILKTQRLLFSTYTNISRHIQDSLAVGV